MASKSVGLMLTFVAIEAVPALPGATKVCHKVDFESFPCKCMFLPPEPSKIFMCLSFLVVVQNNLARKIIINFF
jgi:hypothetical protein